MVKFRHLTAEQQDEIQRRFNLPSNTNDVEVDIHNRPYERISGSLVMCTLKSSSIVGGGFHNAPTRKNS